MKYKYPFLAIILALLLIVQAACAQKADIRMKGEIQTSIGAGGK